MSDLKPYLAAVSMLRLACLKPDLDDEALRAQERLYARALSAYQPVDVREACEDWASREKFWPVLAELLALVREKQAIREAAALPRLAPPADAKPWQPPQPSDDERIEQWRRNDALYLAMIAEPSTWPSNRETLQRCYETIQRRRQDEHPALLQRYLQVDEVAAE